MPSISAAAPNTAHFVDTEAQTTQIKPSETQSKRGGYLKRAVFATCALGIAGGLAQAFRTHNPQPYYPANRQLQSKNETATIQPTPHPTPANTQERCPKGQRRYDKKTNVRNIGIALGSIAAIGIASASGGNRLESMQSERFKKLQNAVGMTCAALSIASLGSFFITCFVGVIAAMKTHNKCY